jgi:hypothetical protein
VKKATLAYLRGERARLTDELRLLENGAREVFQKTAAGRDDIIAKEVVDIRRRLTRLEEMLAAIEAGVL